MSWDDDNDDGAWAPDDDGAFGDDDVETANPAISREEDMRTHSPPASVGGTVERQPVALVAVYSNDGQPLVARTVMENGKPRQLEQFRRPTPDEYNAIMFGAKIVRGGVVAADVSTAQHTAAQMQRTPLGAWSAQKKLAVFGLGALAVGATTYGIYRWRKGKR